MNEHPNAAIVRSAYEAMARGDMPAMAEVLDEDIIWHESNRGSKATTGGATRCWRLWAGSSRRRAWR
jgi:ketosteroid isomerase-like protein